MVHIGVNVEKLFNLLTEQILAGLCFGNGHQSAINVPRPNVKKQRAWLPSLSANYRRLGGVLATDFNGDPVRQSFGEVIYYGRQSHRNYRMAHKLLEFHVTAYPHYHHRNGT